MAIGRTGEGNTFEADYVLAGSRPHLAAQLSRMADGEHDTVGYWFTAIGAIGLVLTLVGWIAFVVSSVRATLKHRHAETL